MPAAYTELLFSSSDPLSVPTFTPFCSGKDFPILAENFLFFSFLRGLGGKDLCFHEFKSYSEKRPMGFTRLPKVSVAQNK